MSNKDTIYRQDALDALESGKDKTAKGDIGGFYNAIIQNNMDKLRNLPSAESEINKQELIRTMNAGIITTNTEDVYSCGMRNGIRWCRALLEDDQPKFEDASQYAEPRKNGKWVVTSEFEDCCYAKCNQCKVTQVFYYNKPLTNFCPECGADMRSK